MTRILAKNEAVGLDGPQRGRVVTCREGILWVTQEGDGRDYLLRAGGSLTIRCKGKVVVTGLAASSILSLGGGDGRKRAVGAVAGKGLAGPAGG